jgi:Kef-type K+ transport system membrane component KefB
MTAHQKRQRVLAYLMGGITLAASAFVYQQQQFVGFPDGFLTNLDRAEKTLFGFLIWASLAAGLWFIFLGCRAAKRNISKQLYTTVIAYTILVALVLGVDFYLRQRLDSGGGG